MGALDQLYQQIILDHARERHGSGLRPVGPGHLVGESRQYNPLCGDEVTVRVALRDPAPGAGTDPAARTVADLSWDGEGCSISQAAASVMHDLVVGNSVREALAVLDAYREMVRSRGSAEPDEDLLGDATAFAGVGRHANRVKCAMVGWTAFEGALLTSAGSAAPGGSDTPVETEGHRR